MEYPEVSFIDHMSIDDILDFYMGKMQEQYKEKFGSYFLYFNYADFPGSKTQRPAEMYRDALRKAVADDKPHQIVSHRYDHSDH